MSTYLFENAGQPTGQRFRSLETLYDPWTIRHLEATGIGPGWRYYLFPWWIIQPSLLLA
jgi:hypothetical protein